METAIDQPRKRRNKMARASFAIGLTVAAYYLMLPFLGML